MVQTMKEYQKEYFEKEGYTIIDNMENAISAFCERYPQHTNVAEESILNDTNCDWVVLNDGSVAVLPGVCLADRAFVGCCGCYPYVR